MAAIPPMGQAGVLRMSDRWGQGRGGRPWRRLREAVARRDQYRCKDCNRLVPLEDGDCDHEVPESKGGKTEMGNLAWRCREPCHRLKTERESLEARGIKPKAVIGEDGWPM